MRIFSTIVLSSVFLAAAFVAAVRAGADDTIKIGEINSYSAIPSFTEPYRKGWQLAFDEINAAGGVDGKKLEVISKDDGGKPADAVTAANELVASDGVAMLAGTFFSNIGLAVSDYAKQKKIFFLAAEPLTDAITLSKGNRYTFRLRPGTYEQAAMLADEAAKLPAKKWATIAPNYEYGQSAVAAFRKLLSAKRPDIEWVGEQWPPQGKIDAGARGGDRQDRARRDLQRHFRGRPRQARARGRPARPFQGSRSGQHARWRAGISRPAQG
jgi:branched-chain amino acid transport system substrate-binding protein